MKRLKIVCGWCSAPDPTGRTYDTPPDSLVSECVKYMTCMYKFLHWLHSIITVRIEVIMSADN